jgi:CDP-glucose 4,6-dehydratase
MTESAASQTNPNPSFWKGKKVLLTGHTGFKGSWLALWLLELGAQVTGVALEPDQSPNLFEQLDLAQRLDHRPGDIRNWFCIWRLSLWCGSATPSRWPPGKPT